MQLLDVKTAATRLSLHPETLRDYLRLGIVSGVKVGRVWRISEADLRSYVKKLKEEQARDSSSRGAG